jgi:nucleotide-binding universal stress UspA family protein
MQNRFRTILVPTDFSEDAEAALELAVALAAEGGATIHLLHAYEIPISAVPPYGIELPPSLVTDVRDAAARRLEKSAAKVRSLGVRCDAHLVHAPPVDGIVDAAGSLHADLVVMGTRGLTGFKHVLLGSVAERTIRSAPCPVLTVKPRPK